MVSNGKIIHIKWQNIFTSANWYFFHNRRNGPSTKLNKEPFFFPRIFWDVGRLPKGKTNSKFHIKWHFFPLTNGYFFHSTFCHNRRNGPSTKLNKEPFFFPRLFWEVGRLRNHRSSLTASNCQSKRIKRKFHFTKRYSRV